MKESNVEKCPELDCGKPLGSNRASCHSCAMQANAENKLAEKILRADDNARLIRVTRSDWEARKLTMRAARRLADRLEGIATDVIEERRLNRPEDDTEEARLDKSFRTLFASLTALLASLPNAEREGK